MSRAVRILPRARGDVDRIFDWLGQRSPQGAASWYEAFAAAVSRVARSADEYPRVPEASHRWTRDVRQAMFKTRRGRRYRIVFELTEAEVCILRVRGPGQPPLRRRDLPPS